MSFQKKTVRDVPLSGHTVLVRVDYNVPLAKDGSISDDLRIRGSLPTLQYLLARGCKVVLISHLGRPEGRDRALSLEPVAERLGELLEKPVIFVDDINGDIAYQAVRRAERGSIIMLQNLRFDPGEEADSEKFAKGIVHAAGADYFVQDGFGVVHRAHASTRAITLYAPSVAGLLLEHEYMTITNTMTNPQLPLVAILGGAKVSDKIGLVEQFVRIADTILIGGAMANTFLAYKGIKVGESKKEEGQTETLDKIYQLAHEKVGDAVDEFIVLPTDAAVASAVDVREARRNRALDEIESDDIILDIGPKTIERYTKIAAEAKTVLWNGTMGMAELPNFSHGSARLALTLATHPEVISILGGGDTADFALKWDVKQGGSFTHVSTGGGAGLDLMAGKKLPGIESLLDAS